MAALQELRDILIGSVPTFILVWILYVFVSRMFFRPLKVVLNKRRESTLGLRQKAEVAISESEQKAAEYQKSLRAAKAEIYRNQEQDRQKALESKAAVLRDTQERADEMVAQARREIQSDVDSAKGNLAGDIDQLAGAIATAIIKPRPSQEPVGSGVSGSDGD